MWQEAAGGGRVASMSRRAYKTLSEPNTRQLNQARCHTVQHMSMGGDKPRTQPTMCSPGCNKLCATQAPAYTFRLANLLSAASVYAWHGWRHTMANMPLLADSTPATAALCMHNAPYNLHCCCCRCPHCVHPHANVHFDFHLQPPVSDHPASPVLGPCCHPLPALTVLLLRPMALAFQALKVPLGSVWYSAGLPSGLKPTMSVLMPKGRTPPLCAG